MGQAQATIPRSAVSLPCPAPMSNVTLRLFDRIEAARPDWLDLETRSLACLYQTHDWLAPWQAHVGSRLGHQPCIVVGDMDGRPAFLWPLAIVRGRLDRRLEWLGARHGNQNPGLWTLEGLEQLRADDMAQALRRVALHAQVDRIDLANVPQTVHGKPHPFSGLPQRLSVNAVHVGPLDQDYDALLRRRHDRDGRRKLDKKAKALARLGPVSVKTPQDPADVIALLDVFVGQREARARSTGIPNVFSDPNLKAALQAMLVGSGDRPPRIRLTALEVGGLVRATYVTGISGGRLYGYSNSIAGDDSLPFSPGIQLLTAMIRQAAADPGLSVLDLGLGDERYKQAWTDPEPLMDIGFACSLRGRIALACGTILAALKRRARASRLFWTVYRRLRRTLAPVRTT